MVDAQKVEAMETSAIPLSLFPHKREQEFLVTMKIDWNVTDSAQSKQNPKIARLLKFLQ